MPLGPVIATMTWLRDDCMQWVDPAMTTKSTKQSLGIYVFGIQSFGKQVLVSLVKTNKIIKKISTIHVNAPSSNVLSTLSTFGTCTHFSAVLEPKNKFTYWILKHVYCDKTLLHSYIPYEPLSKIILWKF